MILWFKWKSLQNDYVTLQYRWLAVNPKRFEFDKDTVAMLVHQTIEANEESAMTIASLLQQIKCNM